MTDTPLVSVGSALTAADPVAKIVDQSTTAPTTPAPRYRAIGERGFAYSTALKGTLVRPPHSDGRAPWWITTNRDGKPTRRVAAHAGSVSWPPTAVRRRDRPARDRRANRRSPPPADRLASAERGCRAAGSWCGGARTGDATPSSACAIRAPVRWWSSAAAT